MYWLIIDINDKYNMFILINILWYLSQEVVLHNCGDLQARTPWAQAEPYCHRQASKQDDPMWKENRCKANCSLYLRKGLRSLLKGF